jgi:hypothetical protein
VNYIPAQPGFFVQTADGVMLPVVAFGIEDGGTLTPIVCPPDLAGGARLVFPMPTHAKVAPPPKDEPPVFGTKTFIKRSHWRFMDGTSDFLFTVEPGDPLPEDARVSRVSRDRFDELRKITATVDVDALRRGTVKPTGKTPGTPLDDFDDII